MSIKTVLHSPVSLAKKRIMIIAPHPDDEVIGCGALLLHLSSLNHSLPDHERPEGLFVVYAVSGFNGVTDNYLRSSGYPGAEEALSSEQKKREYKTAIRIKEIENLATYLEIIPVWGHMPFYEKQEKNYSDDDIKTAVEVLNKVSPDVVFIIDERDPHKTHVMVHHIFMQALRQIKFAGHVFGYHVWGEGYQPTQAMLSLAFDSAAMEKKEHLINFYHSQVVDPAAPHANLTFLEMMKVLNAKMATEHKAPLPFLEVYKKLSF